MSTLSADRLLALPTPRAPQTVRLADYGCPLCGYGDADWPAAAVDCPLQHPADE